MASFRFLLFFLFTLSFLIIISESQTTSKPTKLVLQVAKDRATNLHVANIQKRTPPLKVPFVIDLNGRFMWVNCENQYLSSTYNAPLCHSTLCSKANSHYCHKCPTTARPGCHNNTCGLMAVNPVTHEAAMGELAQDALWLPSSTQGSSPGPMVRVPQFLFSCAPSHLLQRGLPRKTQGVADLGHAPISLPIQLSSHFGFQQKFALCLTSTNENGVIFFGQGPYYMLPGIDVSRPVSYTPLTISQQGEYHINVRAIKINNKLVPLNSSLITPTKVGLGRVKLCTTTPYTVLEHSIFNALNKAFADDQQLKGVPQVENVQPFGACFDSRKLSFTKMGPVVPNVDLVLQNNVVWRIHGTNSMVQARPGVMCLGFVDGGVRPTDSVVIGTLQMEDNLLQFDLASSRLGFSSSLLYRRTRCSNFNFTSSTTTP
ncbi:hypothetical protein FNV43_RR04885 [Rhamnella rubrinervis]|uniref:Peptidase A1 domain-containing protein n=1 Tax=Rhamnella rubrinervis TaxID=2594499 RepID=A0A8K0HMU8_9ROSA|nr:hypothetical protein FNV43_RR04885 [Rhamnella rubrinervis]